MVNASPLLVSSFTALALVVAGAFVYAVYRSAPGAASAQPGARRATVFAAMSVVIWLVATFALAASGRLSFTSRPPTMALLLAVAFALGIAIGVSRLGLRLATGLPLAALVGAQAFRFPLELLLHRAYAEGLMPVQMSYSGFNLDILTGISAIVVAMLVARRPGALVAVRIWNTAGSVLLANIVTIAVLSAPTPIRVFHTEPANVWITHAPWVWLPTVFVVAAIAGHITVYRRLRIELSRAIPAGTSGTAIASTSGAMG